MNKITKDQIKHIAHLAKLELSENEADKYTKEFEEILGYISQIEEVDVSDIEDKHNLANYKGNVLNKDEVKASTITRDKMLQNATKGRSSLGYVKVSKIVSKEE